MALSAARVRMLAALGLAIASLEAPAAAQAPFPGQRLEVTAVPDRAGIGDPIALRLRLHLTERDILADSVPRVLGELPDGVRLLEIGKLVRQPGAARVFEAEARAAFYRPGRQAAPTFGVPFRHVVAGISGMIPSMPASVEIVPVLPEGNPPLRDIKEIERRAGPDPLLVAGALAAVLGGFAFWWVRRRRRRAAAAAEAPAPVVAGPEPGVLGPYERALARLTQIERERWPSRGEVERHYEAVADVLRRYLEDGLGVPALERTTTELLWMLPPPLAEGGLRERCGELLGEADLVKFARLRPDEMTAAAFLRRARELVAAWRAAPAVASDDAIALRDSAVAPHDDVAGPASDVGETSDANRTPNADALR